MAYYDWYARATPETKEAHRERNRRDYERRKAAGLCVQSGCDSAPEAGRVRCKRHLEMVREALRA